MLQDNQQIAVVGTSLDEDGVWPVSRIRDHFGQRAVDELEAAAAAGNRGCMFAKVPGDRAGMVMLTICAA
jgi:hypothetical protein